MQYVVVLDIDPAELEGDDSIDNACRLANAVLGGDLRAVEGTVPPTVRPLSEVIAS